VDVTSVVSGEELAVGGHAWFFAPFLFILFPCDFMEFAWTGTVFYGVRNVVGSEVEIKLEPIVEKQQLSEWVFVTFGTHPDRPRATFSLITYLFVPCAVAVLL
jgi:hypothetical protein